MSFNIIISLAGKSERFFKNGFSKPKYYLPMYEGKTMIEMAIDTLQIPGILYLIVQREHCNKYQIDTFLKEKYPSAILCYLDEYTQGSAESCYLATKQYIDNDTPLVISNCDQTLEWDSTDFINKTLDSSSSGCLLTFFANTTKNSYAAIDELTNKVTNVAEKEVISTHSLVGVHSWKRGSDFCRSFEYIKQNNIRANNEYYVSITYNYLINQDLPIYIVPLKEESEKYWSVGTPEQYYDYLQNKFGNVKSSHISTMTRGWFIGDFTPSVLRTSHFEVGLMSHKKGENYAPHLHNELDEYNLLVSGKMMINNEIIEEGEIFIIKKGMLTKSEFFEDCKIVCVKQPSIPSDKLCY